MSNELTPFGIFFDSLRANFDGDLKISFDENRQTGVMSGTSKGKRYSLSVTRDELGEIRRESIHEVPKRKAEYAGVVKKMRNEDHMTQSEIAEQLGISQSYVSRLLK